MTRTEKKDETDTLKGTTKAAVLLIALGPEMAADVLKLLTDKEVEAVSLEIARLQNIPGETMERVLNEYYEVAMARKFIGSGGVSFAKETLEKAVGPQKTSEILGRVQATSDHSAFQILHTVDTAHLISLLESEHPQTAAVILSHLTAPKAAEVLKNLDPEFRIDVLYRLATMKSAPTEMLSDVEDVIRQHVGSVKSGRKPGGASAVASIMNTIGRDVEQQVIAGLEQRDASLAGRVKDLMFVFDDMVTLSDRDLQRVLAEVDQKQVALALKAAPDELKQKVLSNLSERASAMLTEELELLGPARLKDVEAAQFVILETVRSLEERSEITLGETEAEVMV